MIIFAKADGTVVETKPTPFYQGSSLKGSIYLVAPFPNNNGVTVHFQLPNGNVTKAYPMTPTGEVEGVMLDGYEVSAWTWDVKNAMVTAIPGVVTATITVYNGEPNITYYGDCATFTAITNIENPQTNAYAYCREDGKVYKYNGNIWAESDITISANDYVKTTIVSSFPIIKGTPNALDVSTPSASEWETIISELNAIGGKVTKPLMINFTYDVETGESVKTYNNGAVQTVEFPRALPEGSYSEDYQSFTKTEFDTWEESDNKDYSSKMLTIGNSTIQTNEFDIAVFKKDENVAEKMNPLIVVDAENSTVKIYSNEVYAGYALFFWKGSFIEQNYLPAINTAIKNTETATANTNNAIKNAEDIVSEIQTKLDNGDFVGAPFRIYKVYYSIAKMQEDFANDDVPLYGFVVIETGEVDNPDNAQLYMKDKNSWVFITDLSGAQGIQGPQGRRGNSFLFYYGKVTDINGNVVTSPEIGVRYNFNPDELTETPMLSDLFIDSAGNIYRVSTLGSSTKCIWTEVSVRDVNLLPGQGNGSIIKQGFTTTDTDNTTYEVPNAEANGDGAVNLMGKRYDRPAWENSSANGKQAINLAVSGHADGDFSATFNHRTQAYQRGGMAINGGCRVGMTIAEFNDKYATAEQKATAGYDRTKLNGGIDEPIIEPHQDLTWDKAFSFGFAKNELCEALGRNSTAGGFKSIAFENLSIADGIFLRAKRIGQTVHGVYNEDDFDATYIIGNGWETNGKDFTTGTEPTGIGAEFRRFNNFIVKKNGSVEIRGDKLDKKLGEETYTPTLKLTQHPNDFSATGTQKGHHPLVVAWDRSNNSPKAELYSFKRADTQGTGYVTLQYVINGKVQSSMKMESDKVTFNKPIYVNNTPVGSGGTNNVQYLFMDCVKTYLGKEMEFRLPDLTNIKKITIEYTAQSYPVSEQYRNENIVIYENGTKYQPTLELDVEETTHMIGTYWSSNIFCVDFYGTIGGMASDEVSILFKIEYK